MKAKSEIRNPSCVAPAGDALRNRLLLLVCLAASLLGAAEPRPDEQVVFYPTAGWRVPGGWEVQVRGCVFELEPRPLATPLLRRALELNEDELAPEEKALFRERARLFMVDHEGSRTVRIRLAGGGLGLGPIRLKPSAASGHFTGRFRLKDEALAAAGLTNGCLRFEQVTASPHRPAATGEVHLLPETGLSVISDIDDTIKVSEVLDRRELLRNTFCRPFKPVPGMAAVYQDWARTHGARFHYVSASPWQLYLPLAEFVRGHGFPAGTFDLKNLRLKDGTFLAAFSSQENYKPGVITPLLERFPRRRFLLVGDSGEQDPEIYGALARQFPAQILRICIRDVTGEAPDSARYQRAFAGLPPGLWRIFKDPAAIAGAAR